jgi:hypothetical protein
MINNIDRFFDGTREKWKTPIGESWGKEIESRRTQRRNNQQQEENDDNTTTAKPTKAE